MALAALFQMAFLFELHSPLPSDRALWSLSILSAACVAVVLLVRGSLAVKAKISYGPERVYRQRQFGAGPEYRVRAVIVYSFSANPQSPWIMRASSASTWAKARLIEQ